MAISAFPQKDRIPCKFMIWVHTPQFLFFPQTFETYFKQLQWPPERFSISNPLILKHYMKYWINFFPDWKQTFRNCDGSCRTRTLRKRQSSRGTTCWESLNRPFSNIPFSGRAALPEHRDWIYAQTAVLPLDMSFTISIIFLFAWSGLNQKNSTEIFSAVWHLPLLFWHGVYSPWVPFPVRYMQTSAWHQ